MAISSHTHAGVLALDETSTPVCVRLRDYSTSLKPTGNAACSKSPSTFWFRDVASCHTQKNSNHVVRREGAAIVDDHDDMIVCVTTAFVAAVHPAQVPSLTDGLPLNRIMHNARCVSTTTAIQIPDGSSPEPNPRNGHNVGVMRA